MNKAFPYKLYLVIGQDACRYDHFLKVAEQAVQGGVDLVQLREKHTSPEAFEMKALRLKELLDHYSVPLIINDSFKVAKNTDAHGIHLGTSDAAPLQVRREWGVQKYIGYSVEKMEQFQTKDMKTADYLGISPVYETPTKTDTITEWGLNGIRQIRAMTKKPLVAIGNMNASNAKQVIRAGADCIAVVSAICASTNPAKTAEKIRNQIEKA